MARRSVAWGVAVSGTPQRLTAAQVDLESRLESWVENDPSIVADDFVVIGRQVSTDFDTRIDLLGVNRDGDLVVVELKRDQTWRETVAQALEYAAWASKLTYEQVIERASAFHGGEEKFRAAYRRALSTDLPDTLNDGQRILLVAPIITDQTAMVIDYLAQQYRVPINGVSFDLFQLGDQAVLVRQTLVADETAATSAAGSKRRPRRSLEEMLALAENNGVGSVADTLLELRDLFTATTGIRNAWSFRIRPPGGKLQTLIAVYPASKPQAVILMTNPQAFSETLGRDIEDCRGLINRVQQIGQPEQPYWEGWMAASVTTDEQAAAASRLVRDFFAEPGMADEVADMPDEQMDDALAVAAPLETP